MASMLTVFVVGAMCTAVLLTTGRTVAAEQAVLAEVDAAGTRSIVVRAVVDAGVTVTTLERLRAVAGVAYLAGFGPVVDARNPTVPGTAAVALRPAYGLVEQGPATADSWASQTALASPAAAAELGLHDGTGALLAGDGQEVVVTGAVVTPSHLTFLEPLLIAPVVAPGPDEPVTLLVVVAESPGEVAAVEAVVRDLLPAAEPGDVTVETSAELAAVRSAIAGELGTHGRSTVLGILVVSALLVTVNLLAVVAMRRRDFGRRRALGATRSFIVAIIMLQVALLAIAGASLGTVATLVGLVLSQSPLPGVLFSLALGTAAVLAATAAAVVPAIIASRRDPLHELRLP
ncbi:hypothetical protein JQS43_22815 [Natronosporangium hydrolyticum]|uniref:ABC3 transporter permease C-terminal domain-containing protein n=2 Tax=Natronosporangium hydrolyticum TaxID=2811111 RepID=A0A895Y975_9ACTN|nr:FtsX-like permease family protein [Natronosporangium hydrolyticum]QSB14304.1 hypothetical protein JQS43_22815 [Natronosporangium hydrolyticum]